MLILPRAWSGRLLALGTAILICFCALTAIAQDEAKSDAKKPAAITASDPKIPEDHLALLVKPLTKSELIVEADAWRDLVKAKVQEIAEQQIAVKKKSDIAEKAEEAKAAIAKPGSEASESVGEKIDAAEEQKEDLVESLPELREDQVALVTRLNVVLDALENKGGDVKTYRQYVTAVTGIDLGASDASASLAIIKSWLTSEQGGLRWFWNIVKFLVILLAFYFSASIVAGLARRAVSRVHNTSQLLVSFVGKFVKQAMMIIGLIVALAALEVNIGPLLAAVGAAGFVIGFALQDTLSNFASGLLILAYQPFDVGDVIEAAGISGIVDSVSLFSTHIRTFDNKMMIVPNNDIWGGTITNATASDTRRVDMTFGIGYEDDIGKAKQILEKLVNAHALVLHDPVPVVQLHELGDSSLNFVCRPWAKTTDYWTVYWDLTRSVKEEFDRNGISIPFPQRDIHVYQEAASRSE